MIAAADPRLERILGGPRLASLRRRLRQRFERAALDKPLLCITLDALEADEYEVLASLVGGRQRAANSFALDLAAADAALVRAGIAASLRDALEQLDGPIMHLATVQSEQAQRWQQVIAECKNRVLFDWLQSAANLGLLKRLARSDSMAAGTLVRRVEAVLGQLPGNGITRAQLAAQTLGDAHALDEAEPVATLTLAALRARPIGMTDVDDTDRARDVWASVGVLVNELARPALCLNLPIEAASHVQWQPGEPAFVSLRLMVRAEPAWRVAGCDVFVCENPNVVARAADQLGARCKPLVCTDGMPAAAQRRLLSLLTAAGARLRYHGDFDWAGIRIANHVMREHGALAWRMSTSDYVSAAEGAPRPGKALGIPVVQACWDLQLATAMQVQGVAIAEEAVSESLLIDLQRLVP